MNIAKGNIYGRILNANDEADVESAFRCCIDKLLDNKVEAWRISLYMFEIICELKNKQSIYFIDKPVKNKKYLQKAIQIASSYQNIFGTPRLPFQLN